jgi:predicted DCC family thiol-disulfide oxidoreductase YuxK
MMLVVVFDEDCGVCQAAVAWIRRRDGGRRFQFVGNEAAELPAGVSREETEHTVVVMEGARKWVRAEAVSRILRELPGWSIPAALLRVPGLKQVAGLGYDAFARRRHRISAALGMRVCAVPPRK